MANIIEITDFELSELDVYARYSEVQLLRIHEPKPGIFIAESPKVIERRWMRVMSRSPCWWSTDTLRHRRKG